MTKTLTRPADIAALTTDTPLVPPRGAAALLAWLMRAYAPVAPVRPADRGVGSPGLS